ncbi:3'-5' exonuclease [Clostridium malenominatum]|uniref:3'-5' exonuclease n=1 Tax=Clostridium malenominatum TaxID=1539 RepID=A0ABP3U8I3_9CLOT
MNYIIFDLEFNQYYNFKEGQNDEANPKCPFEIIQIGAVKLDTNLNTISTFNKIVRPELYTRIHPYVKEITNITMEQLSTGVSFKETYKEFIQFIDAKSIFCIWGMADIKEFLRNAEYYKLETSSIPKKYINVQQYASKYFNFPRGSNIGLSKAVTLLNIQSNALFHDAFNDAYYTAEVFKKIYNNEMKPKIYNNIIGRYSDRNSSSKGTIDTFNLIKQFEKMFKREMTEEEISIIKLAYIMGKTGQFFKEQKTDTNV